MRKRKIKEIENISFAVGYALTTAFIEENNRNPTEEEQQKIAKKSAKYIYEILDKLKYM